MACDTIQFKRGSTFELEVTLIDAESAPVVFDVADMQAQVRDGDTILSTLDIATTAIPGTYLLRTNDDTSSWDLGVIQTDIRVVTSVDAQKIFIDTPTIMPGYFDLTVYYEDWGFPGIKVATVGAVITDSASNVYSVIGYYDPADPTQNETNSDCTEGWVVKVIPTTAYETPAQDIQYDSVLSINPQVVYSDTISISVVRQITRVGA